MPINEDKLFKNLMIGARGRVAKAHGVTETYVDYVRFGKRTHLKILLAWQKEEKKARQKLRAFLATYEQNEREKAKVFAVEE